MEANNNSHMSGIEKNIEMTDNIKKDLDLVVAYYLEDYTAEELLENFDLTLADLLLCAYNSGLIDPELLETFLTAEV
jgi:hypothetical protein